MRFFRFSALFFLFKNKWIQNSKIMRPAGIRAVARTLYGQKWYDSPKKQEIIQEARELSKQLDEKWGVDWYCNKSLISVRLCLIARASSLTN